MLSSFGESKSLLYIFCGISVLLCVVVAKALHSLRAAQTQLARSQTLLAAERQGRITGEKRLRELLQQKGVSNNNSRRLHPIGIISSPFTRRNGTPRQGGLVASTRAVITFDIGRVDPTHSLEGIDAYSHVWLIWEFHENTNVAGTVKAKVCPPRAGGAKVGLYATRTPHRHNPIGLSLVRVDRVSKDKKALWVSGADLTNNTPILDIKPYTPAFEAIPTARVPQWVGSAVDAVFANVHWEAQARKSLEDLVKARALRFYFLDDEDQLRNVPSTAEYQSRSRGGSNQKSDALSAREAALAVKETNTLAQTISELCKLQDFRSRHQRDDLKADKYSFCYDRLEIHIELRQSTSSSSTSSTSSSSSSSASYAAVEEEVVEPVSSRLRRSRSTMRDVTAATGAAGGKHSDSSVSSASSTSLINVKPVTNAAPSTSSSTSTSASTSSSAAALGVEAKNPSTDIWIVRVCIAPPAHSDKPEQNASSGSVEEVGSD